MFSSANKNAFLVWLGSAFLSFLSTTKQGLTRQLLGYFATRDLLGGGGGGRVKRSHVITRERMAAERRATRRSKALDETILKHPLNFPNEVTCQGQGQDKCQNRGFQVTSRRDLKIISFGPKLTPNTPKIYGKALIE